MERARLGEALKTGKPQNEIKRGEDVFEAVYATPDRLRLFLRSMTGHSLPSAIAIAEKFPWQKYRTFVDVGAAEGCLPVRVALVHQHLVGESFDLSAVQSFFEEYVSSFGLRDRLRFRAGDFFKDPIPSADVLVMGMILHDWNLEKKMHLIRSAYDALPPGGALVAIEALIDDSRRENLFGLLMSLNMLIEFGDAFDYSGADFRGWCSKVGFQRFDVIHLAGASSAAVAYK